MDYISTRDASRTPAKFTDILLGGLAPDGGLYLPAEYPQLDDATLTSWRALLGRLRDGDFDGARPAPLHGDLWSGNVMWSEDGVVLIDPAAHTGHPETDLAALQIFGTPHVERILAAYAEEAGWETGKNADWRLREPLHELQLLFLHVRLFGGSYEDQAMAAVHASLRLS